VTALLLAAPLLVGCGGGAHAGRTASSAPRPVGGYLAGADLERQLGIAFRTGLYRLAVMSQKTEDAMDLGQRLPTGLVREVRCASTTARPGGDGVWTWGCDVRWKSVEGRAQRTRYDVRLTRGECFAAGAAPRRQPHYDSTIRTYSEDPLDALVSVRRG
jgi:hypothetical protein